jgi:hypothetical protein
MQNKKMEERTGATPRFYSNFLSPICIIYYNDMVCSKNIYLFNLD